MKRVVSSREVVHLWAHQSQPEARNQHNSIHFDGRDLFSYRTLIAVKLADVTIVSGERYSNATAKQLSWVRQAIVGRVIVLAGEVPTRWGASIDEPETRQAEAMKLADKAREALGKATRARSDENRLFYLREASSIVEDARFLASDMGALGPLPGRYDGIEQAAQIVKADKADRITRWLAGGAAQLKATMFRCLDGETVESTHGARVTVRDARRLWDAIKAGTQNVPVGPYGFAILDGKGGAKVGCHTISGTEVVRFAGVMGWK